VILGLSFPKEDHRQRVLQNKVLTIIFGPKRDEEIALITTEGNHDTGSLNSVWQSSAVSNQHVI
jgi:hypothetical protein